MTRWVDKSVATLTGTESIPCTQGGVDKQTTPDAINALLASASPLTTKGDIYIFSTIDDRLPVGGNDEVLTADSSEPTGLKWAASGGGVAPYTYSNPPFADVSSLLHFDGTNGSTTITDQVGGNTWTANGGAALSTVWFAEGTASLLIAGGSNSSTSMPTNSKYDVGTGDWTIEFTYKYVGSPQTSARLFQTRDGDVYGGIGLNMNSSGSAQNLHLYMSSNGSGFDIANGLLMVLLSTTTPSEVLIQRSGTTITCVVNGFLASTNTLSSASAVYYNSGDTVILGGNATGTSRSINAYLDEFRFTKGDALLTANRIYPLAAFPDS